MILATKIPQTPKNILEQIICDADLDYLGRDDYEKNSNFLLQELKLKNDVTELEWLKIQVNFLEKHTYFTNTSISLRNKLKLETLTTIQNKFKNIFYGRSRA